MSFFVSKKRIIFLSLLVIFIVISSLYVTYAVNVYVEEGTSVNYDMSLNFDLSNSLDVQVVVPAGKTKVFDLDITNPYNDSIQYGIAYAMVSPTILPSGVIIAKLSTSKNETQGLINASSTITASIIVENTSSSSVTIIFSIITGYKNGGDLIVPTGSVIVTEEYSIAPVFIVKIVKNEITFENNSEWARVTINGVVYDGSSEALIQVEAGTIIECYVYIENTPYGGVYVDEIAKVSGETGTYSYIVESNCTISISASRFTVMGTTQIQGVITIKTEA